MTSQKFPSRRSMASSRIDLVELFDLWTLILGRKPAVGGLILASHSRSNIRVGNYVVKQGLVVCVFPLRPRRQKIFATLCRWEVFAYQFGSQIQRHSPPNGSSHEISNTCCPSKSSFLLLTLLTTMGRSNNHNSFHIFERQTENLTQSQSSVPTVSIPEN